MTDNTDNRTANPFDGMTLAEAQSIIQRDGPLSEEDAAWFKHTFCGGPRPTVEEQKRWTPDPIIAETLAEVEMAFAKLEAEAEAIAGDPFPEKRPSLDISYATICNLISIARHVDYEVERALRMEREAPIRKLCGPADGC